MHIVGASASGAWSGKETQVASFLDGTWQFSAPQTGWCGYVSARNALVIFDGTDWQDVSPDLMQNASLFGLGMLANSGNPFAAKLNTALWTAQYSADGGTGDLRQTLNKELTGSVAGFVFQENFQTRALLGLFGDNRLRLSVTADGATFNDGLEIENATGIASLPALPRFKAYTNYDNYVGVGSWTKLAMNMADFNDQGCFDAATNLFTAPVDGTYQFGANLMFKINASLDARLQGRLVLNAATPVRGSTCEVSGLHESDATVLQIQSFASLSAGDSVEVQANFRAFDGYVKADESCFWGHKVG